jgi:hypothetical protein
VTKYTSGRRIEYLARDILVSRGYMVVRSAGSKGPFDLVAVPMDGGARFIQIKKGRQSSKKALGNLKNLSCVYKGIAMELWVYEPKIGFHITIIAGDSVVQATICGRTPLG